MRASIAAFGLLFTVALAAPGAGAQDRELRLAFVGDIMGHDVNYLMEDFRDIYRGVRDLLLAADVAFANLEFPLDPFQPSAGYPYFNGTREYLAAAVDAGFTLLSTANNHAFDGNMEGVLQTIRALEDARSRSARPFAYSGTRGNPARPFIPSTLAVKGVRIAFLAVSQFLNRTDGGRYVHVVDYSRPVEARAFVERIREIAPLYDLLIVSYHGDREYVQVPSEAKRAFFRQLLAAGAGIVVGHHPHVVQDYEVVSVAGQRRLAMYSMGNFISGMTWRIDPLRGGGRYAATGESYVLRATVRCTGAGCSVTEAEPVPIANYRDERGHMVVAPLGDLADGTVAVSPAWRSYYARRLALMRAFLGMGP